MAPISTTSGLSRRVIPAEKWVSVIGELAVLSWGACEVIWSKVLSSRGTVYLEERLETVFGICIGALMIANPMQDSGGSFKWNRDLQGYTRKA